MLQHSWIFTGLVATVATVITLQTAEEEVAIASGLIGFFAWLLWGYSALNVVTHSGGTEFAFQYPSMAVFGVLMAVPNLFVALTGPLRIASQGTDLAKEMQ